MLFDIVFKLFCIVVIVFLKNDLLDCISFKRLLVVWYFMGKLVRIDWIVRDESWWDVLRVFFCLVSVMVFSIEICLNMVFLWELK